MCRKNTPRYKNMTKERTTRQTFVNLVGKFDLYKNHIIPERETFIPRIINGENELNNGFASSIHSLLSPQAVQMPSMRFNTKMINSIRLISNKRFIVYHSSLESQSLLFYFFERLDKLSFLRFSFKLSIGCSFYQAVPYNTINPTIRKRYFSLGSSRRCPMRSRTFKV